MKKSLIFVSLVSVVLSTSLFAQPATTTTTTGTVTTNGAVVNTVSTSKWLCTTNASSATTDADKAADDTMAKTALPATDSFAFALQHCRDCTKITCSIEQ